MGPNFQNISQLAMQLIQNNPKIAQSAQAQQYLRIIQSGDSVAGQQLANNILQTYGLTKEQGIQQAMQGFGLFRRQ